MGKSSPPPAPTPPTASEISAANIESAKGLKRLERAMQFGEPLIKEGYRVLNADMPSEGSTPLYETTVIDLGVTYPESVRYNAGSGLQTFALDRHGAIQEGPQEGTHYNDLTQEIAEMGDDVPATQEVQQLIGWELEDGTTQDVVYLDSEDNVVDRNEAIETDFTGLGDIDLARKKWEFEQETSPERAQFMLDLAEQYGPEFVDQAKDLIERSDPTGFAAREMLGELAQGYTPGELPAAPTLDEMGEYAAKEQVGDRPTLGEVSESPLYDRAGDMDALGRITETPTYLESEYGPGYERAGEMDALARQGAFGGYERQADMDALTRAGDMDSLTRQGAFGGMERAGDLGALERVGEMDALERLGGFGGYERAGEMGALERSQAAPSLERLDDIPEIGLDPTSLAGRRYAEQQLIGRAQSGRAGDLMAEEASRLARGRQAASGNIFGGGAVLQEARAVRQAEEAGQRQGISDLLGFLSSGQTAGDYESRIAQQNLMNRLTGIQQRTGAEQSEFGMGQQALGQRNVAQEREYQAALSAMQQRNLAGGGEYGFEAQRTAQMNQAALQERADALGAVGQRNQAEEREYQSTLQALQQRNLAGTTEYSLEAQQVAQMNDASLRERADALASLAQRNTAQERDFQAAVQALQQRNLAEEGEYNLEAQQLAQANQSQLQERADQLGALGQRNEAEQAEFANLQATLAQVNQARGAQFATDAQQQEFNTSQQLRERADELGALAQRNQAQEQEYQGLLQGLSQQQGARTAGFAMDVQGADQRNQATQADFANQQATLAQTNQARQQSFSNAMQRTMTEQQMQQQQMANLQSFSGLAPISGQFGNLGGAQQAAFANYSPVQYQPTNTAALLQNQQNLQGSIFGTQANIWGQQAQAAMQPSGFGSLLGTAAGGLAGGPWGGALGQRMFGGGVQVNPNTTTHPYP